MNRFFSARATGRGQVMVLGCVSLLIIALMLSLSFNITNGVYEKIRVQSQADAQAYSLAVAEARTMNTMALYNRAMAAVLVAQMSLHAWHAIATADVAMLQAGQRACSDIAGKESALCGPKSPHCKHAQSASECASQFGTQHRTWSQILQGLEGSFNDAVDGLKKAVDAMYGKERALISNMKAEINNGSIMQRLRATNAPHSQYRDVSRLNRSEFGCALEGSEMDDECSNGKKQRKSDQNERSKIMQNAANALRSNFHFQAGAVDDRTSTSAFTDRKDARIPKMILLATCPFASWEHKFKTAARVGQGTGVASDPSVPAENVGSGLVSPGSVSVKTFYCFSSTQSFAAHVFSKDDHTGAGHLGSHNKFDGMQMEDVCGGGKNCFINFRSNTDPEADYGQPSVYGAVAQSLRIQTHGPNDGKKGPWEINDNATIRIDTGEAGVAKLRLASSVPALAVSKAKVYFHQPGNWAAPPNMFDPFWKAKLHFFGKEELRTVLQAAGEPHPGVRGPTEGVP